MDFDPGPPSSWATLFSQAPLDSYVHHPSRRFRTEFGPVFYRGRLDGSARILIIGQDPSTDEILAQRALVGASGQRVQGLLQKLGIGRAYIMLNTFLYGIYGQFDATMQAISAAAPVLTYRNSLFDQVIATSPVEIVIAFGKGAHTAFDLWPDGSHLPIFRLHHPSARSGLQANWNQNLPQLLQAVTPEPGAVQDATPYGANFLPEDHAAIPRIDLPFGVPAWHGTGGTHSKRSQRTGIVWTQNGRFGG